MDEAQEGRPSSLRRSNNPVVRYVVFIVQVLHVLVGLAFLVSAFVEFARDPPFFDSVDTHNSSHIASFQNVTGLETESVRRAMDLPILILFLAYFAVLLWRGGWGSWSFLMTGSIILTLIVFLLVNYWSATAFDWRYFGTRGIGVLLQIFTFSVAWATVTVAAMTKSNHYILMISDKVPKDMWRLNILVCWNFFAMAIILFFCLLVWFSRLYFSWACVRSLEEILLLCQFTNQVQCYPCAEAHTCRNVDHCIQRSNSTTVFHCLSPLFMLNVKNAFCVFNYNIGLFTFISVFAYVGGTYFFFKAVLNFSVRCTRVLIEWLIKNLKQKTRQNVNRLQTLTMSMSAKHYQVAKHYRVNESGEEKNELLKDLSSGSDEDDDKPETKPSGTGLPSAE